MAKIGGRRVYPSEVEAALRKHRAVREAAVITRQSERIGTRLVAFVTTSASVDPSTLRKHLSEQLPTAMVPDEVRRVKALPQTSTGKIDYRALQAELTK